MSSELFVSKKNSAKINIHSTKRCSSLFIRLLDCFHVQLSVVWHMILSENLRIFERETGIARIKFFGVNGFSK